jgi:hypothetical protein
MSIGLSTPPPAQANGNDAFDARQKIVAAIGNLNVVVNGLRGSVAVQSFPAIPHEFLISYNSSTGMFTAEQPHFSDLLGIATTSQIGTGTPEAGDYVDGGTGAWTPLPSGPTAPNFSDNETVGGNGTAWILGHTPIAGCVPILMVPPFADYGMFALVLGSAGPYGYTISGANITTVISWPAGSMRAWYRY